MKRSFPGFPGLKMIHKARIIFLAKCIFLVFWDYWSCLTSSWKSCLYNYQWQYYNWQVAKWNGFSGNHFTRAWIQINLHGKDKRIWEICAWKREKRRIREKIRKNLLPNIKYRVYLFWIFSVINPFDVLVTAPAKVDNTDLVMFPFQHFNSQGDGMGRFDGRNDAFQSAEQAEGCDGFRIADREIGGTAAVFQERMLRADILSFSNYQACAPYCAGDFDGEGRLMADGKSQRLPWRGSHG